MTPEHDGSPAVEEIVRHDDVDPDAIEWVGRMFRDWLREHPEDRATYEHAKRMSADASNAAGAEVIDYNQRKQPVVRDTLDRMFRAHACWPPTADRPGRSDRSGRGVRDVRP